MEEELALVVMPREKEIWLYESKWRTADWLEAHHLPHPRTWVFFEKSEALQFVADAQFPLVFKADRGATSHGVVICRDRNTAGRLIQECFGKGYLPTRADRDDRQRGFVLFQEYLPGVKEWRMVRIGDSLICRLKERTGDFHSGSGLVGWAHPATALLDFTWRITETGAFRSMNVDIFETSDGSYYVNELHAVFGDIKEQNLRRGGENMGRWLRTPEGGWEFEAGFFYANACANLRIEEVSRILAGQPEL
jgi:glutathione synthase/RimK-type ligase-like ATP-grasp enzyme